MSTRNDLLFGAIAVELGVLRPEHLAEGVRLQEHEEWIVPPLLGEVLIRRGHLQADHRSKVLREQANRIKVHPEPGPGKLRGEPLGQLLVRLGFINRYQLHECLRVQGWLDEEFGLHLRLGEALVRKGHMTREQVGLALGRQVKELLECPRCATRAHKPKGKGAKAPPCARCGGALRPVAPVAAPEEDRLAELFRAEPVKLPTAPREEEVPEMESDVVPAAPLARSAQEHSLEEAGPAPAAASWAVTPEDLDAARRDGTRHMDRFLLVRRMGSGPRGEIWLAVRADTGARVLVKTMERSSLSAEAGQRWVATCRKVAQSRPPIALRVLGVGQESGRPFLVYEPLPLVGTDELRAHGRIGAPEAWVLGEAVLTALVSLHARGIVHGNLKPANLLLPESARTEPLAGGAASGLLAGVKLADFGLPPLPGLGAPELAGPGAWTPRADLWGAAATLRGLLPDGESDPRCAGVLARALDPDPARRFQGAAEMLQALRRSRG